jgi:hypothetical protein
MILAQLLSDWQRFCSQFSVLLLSKLWRDESMVLSVVEVFGVRYLHWSVVGSIHVCCLNQGQSRRRDVEWLTKDVPAHLVAGRLSISTLVPNHVV